MVIEVLKRCLLAVMVTALLAGPGLTGAALAGDEDAGTYGAPFLGIPVGARLISSSDAVAGMDPDASLLFSNPAFLATIPSSEVFFTTANWLEDMRLSAASAAFPFGRGYTFSLGSRFLYSGDLQGFDDALNVVSEESYYDLGVTGAFAKRFPFGLSLGLGGTWFRQHIYPQDGNGYAFDLGASFERGQYLIHAAAQNVGGRVSFSDAEYTVDSQNMAGLARMFNAGPGQLYAGAQVVMSSAAPTRLEIAADYRPYHLFSVKAALRDVSGSQSDNLRLDAGFGIYYHKISIDYAYTPHEYFSSTHTFSVVFSPGASGDSRTYRDDLEGADSSPTRDDVPEAVEPVLAAPVVAPEGDPRTGAPVPASALAYLVVAGIHGWESSARAEARSYEVLDIPATVEKFGSKYRVIVGRYDNREDAVKAINKFRKSGQKFSLVEVDSK